MKRTRKPKYDVDDMTCILDEECDIVCTKDETDEKYSISLTSDLPEDLQRAYRDCREAQREKVRKAFEEPSDSDSEYEPSSESDEEDSEESEAESEVQELTERSWLFGQSSETEEKLAESAAASEVTESRVKGCRETEATLVKLDQALSKQTIDVDQLRSAVQALTLIADLKFAHVLGAGSNGVVFTVCNPQVASQMLVVKYTFSSNTDHLNYERTMQEKFADAGLGPPVIAYNENAHLLVMAKIDGTVGDLLRRKLSALVLDQILYWIVDLLRRLCDARLLHRDFHWHNFGYRIDLSTRRLTVLLIDFGNAKAQECEPDFEIATLIAFLYNNKLQARFEPTNVAYLHEKLATLYDNNYGPVNQEDLRDPKFWKAIYHAKYHPTKAPKTAHPLVYVNPKAVHAPARNIEEEARNIDVRLNDYKSDPAKFLWFRDVDLGVDDALLQDAHSCAEHKYEASKLLAQILKGERATPNRESMFVVSLSRFDPLKRHVVFSMEYSSDFVSFFDYCHALDGYFVRCLDRPISAPVPDLADWALGMSTSSILDALTFVCARWMSEGKWFRLTLRNDENLQSIQRRGLTRYGPYDELEHLEHLDLLTFRYHWPLPINPLDNDTFELTSCPRGMFAVDKFEYEEDGIAIQVRIE